VASGESDTARGIARFAAVGDVFLGDQPVCVGFGVRSRAERVGYDSFFENVKEVLGNYDTVVANLETVIADRDAVASPRAPARVDRAEPQAAAALRSSGINLVGIANNHIFEYGENGLSETARHLRDNNVEWVGKKNHSICNIAGNRVAFLSWSLVPDTYWPRLDPSGYYNIAGSLAPILDEIQEVRSTADYVVLLLHWGNEFVHQPSRKQREIGLTLIDAGADAIIGHHPHVLQPIERYKNGLIAYSLGNFVMDSWDHEARISIILEVTLGHPLGYRAIPVNIDKHSYQPKIVRDEEQSSKVSAMLQIREPLDDPEYLHAVNWARKNYRRSSLAHFARNIHRVGVGNLAWVLAWGLRRILFLAKVARIEKTDPTVVYKGPMR